MASGASMLQACVSRTHYGCACPRPGLLCSLSARPCSPPRPGPPARDSTVGVGGPQKPQPCLLDTGRGTGTLGGIWGPKEGTLPTLPRCSGQLGRQNQTRKLHNGMKPTTCHTGSYIKIPLLTRQQNSEASHSCPGGVRVVFTNSVAGGSCDLWSVLGSCDR